MKVAVIAFIAVSCAVTSSLRYHKHLNNYNFECLIHKVYIIHTYT